jgi:hypothetical protein
MLLRMALRAVLPRRVVMVSEVELVQSPVFCCDDAVGVHHDVIIAKIVEGVDGVLEFVIEKVNGGQ